MSFTSSIKQEIAKQDLEKCCMRAELSALMQLTSSISISNKKLNLIARSENVACAKRIVFLVKKLYKVDTQLSYIKKANLNKNKVYTVSILGDGKKILEDLGIYTKNKGLLEHPTYLIVVKNCCAKSYLAGCFLAYGSCNSPSNKNYHLELSFTSIEHANFVIKLLSRFDIPSKISKRRTKYVVYIKRADKISDFLRIVEATDSLYQFEDSRISRDIKHSIIRVDNCTIANEMKSMKAAEDQISYMNKIVENGKYDDLEEKLKNVIDIRLNNQDYTLNELCKAYDKKYGEPISKSGLKHRLNKIESIAKGLA